MNKKDTRDFWSALGIVSLLLIGIELIKQLNEDTSTKLYDPRALEELKDDKRFKEVYGRSRGHESTSV